MHAKLGSIECYILDRSRGGGRWINNKQIFSNPKSLDCIIRSLTLKSLSGKSIAISSICAVPNEQKHSLDIFNVFTSFNDRIISTRLTSVLLMFFIIITYMISENVWHCHYSMEEGTDLVSGNSPLKAESLMLERDLRGCELYLMRSVVTVKAAQTTGEHFPAAQCLPVTLSHTISSNSLTVLS